MRGIFKEIQKLIIVPLFFLTQNCAMAESPDCAEFNRWPTMSASVKLKNMGLLADIDLSKTKVTRLASEELPNEKYRQIHRIIFVDASGKELEVITSNLASKGECSESGVEVFVVSKNISE